MFAFVRQRWAEEDHRGFGLLDRAAPEYPTNSIVWPTTGLLRMILLARGTISSDRAGEAPSGSWMIVIRWLYCIRYTEVQPGDRQLRPCVSGV